jgi:uncharacterized membrane protein
MMMFGWLGLLLLGGILIALMIGGGGAFLLRQAEDGSATDGEQKTTARETLDRRLARGEISREEYEDIRRQIES